jgi:hypothetical protein
VRSVPRRADRPPAPPQTGGVDKDVAPILALEPVSTASRVVPPSSDTTMRSSPSSGFTSELLPTFGRPTTAYAHRRFRRRPPARLRAGRQRRDQLFERIPCTRPCSAEMACWRSKRARGTRGARVVVRRVDLVDQHGDRVLALAELARDARSFGQQTGQPSTTRESRRRRARRRVPGSGPPRRAFLRRLLEARGVDHEHATPGDVDRLDDAIARQAGTSSTSARRLPAKRWKSVDFPTFGRPTIRDQGSAGCDRHRWRADHRRKGGGANEYVRDNRNGAH